MHCRATPPRTRLIVEELEGKIVADCSTYPDVASFEAASAARLQEFRNTHFANYEAAQNAYYDWGRQIETFVGCYYGESGDLGLVLAKSQQYFGPWAEVLRQKYDHFQHGSGATNLPAIEGKSKVNRPNTPVGRAAQALIDFEYRMYWGGGLRVGVLGERDWFWKRDSWIARVQNAKSWQELGRLTVTLANHIYQDNLNRAWRRAARQQWAAVMGDAPNAFTFHHQFRILRNNTYLIDGLTGTVSRP